MTKLFPFWWLVSPLGETIATFVMFDGETITVTETVETVQDSITAINSLIMLNKIYSEWKNPSGSGVEMYVRVTVTYTDDSEVDEISLTQSEGYTATVTDGHIKNYLTENKAPKKIELKAWCSGVPASGKEPTIEFMWFGYKV